MSYHPDIRTAGAIGGFLTGLEWVFFALDRELSASLDIEREPLRYSWMAEPGGCAVIVDGHRRGRAVAGAGQCVQTE